MKKITLVAAACALLAQTASAQQFQGLGAADPSQQLKTAGMMNTWQRETQTLRRDEKKEPLVQGTQDPSDPPERSAAPARTAAPAPQPEAAEQAAPAPAPAPVAVVPSPLPSPTPAVAAPAAAPAPERHAAPANAAAWNPASNAATPAAAAVPSNARLDHIRELVDQIKKRRENK